MCINISNVITQNKIKYNINQYNNNFYNNINIIILANVKKIILSIKKKTRASSKSNIYVSYNHMIGLQQINILIYYNIQYTAECNIIKVDRRNIYMCNTYDFLIVDTLICTIVSIYNI